jgi:hypothetical protein
MSSDFRRLLSWPAAFAILFIAIPPLLFYSHPSSFWANTDYEPLGLGDALNLAYRLADIRFYPAIGMEDHPGVPFYFMSWLALALTGYPIAFKGPGFFNTVIDHVESYHQASVWLGALMGGAGVYIFARTARNLVPPGVIAIGLLAWVTSTPATLLMFTTPSIESFGMLINGLFFYTLVRIAYDRDISRGVTALAACVSAFAYLNKLSYINVSLALSVTGIWRIPRRTEGTAAYPCCGHLHRRRSCVRPRRGIRSQALRSSLYGRCLPDAAGNCRRKLPSGEIIGLPASNRRGRRCRGSHSVDDLSNSAAADCCTEGKDRCNRVGSRRSAGDLRATGRRQASGRVPLQGAVPVVRRGFRDLQRERPAIEGRVHREPAQDVQCLCRGIEQS